MYSDAFAVLYLEVDRFLPLHILFLVTVHRTYIVFEFKETANFALTVHQQRMHRRICDLSAIFETIHRDHNFGHRELLFLHDTTSKLSVES